MPLIVANATRETDGSAAQMLERIESPVPIVLVSRPQNFVFNEELQKLDSFVLADFTEYGYDYDFGKRGVHLFGENTEDYQDLFPGKEWEKFEAFVQSNKPLLYLKRELPKTHVNDFYQPISYACWHEIPQIQTKTEFDNRLLEVFYSWGRSHEQRVRLQADLWSGVLRHGYALCDNVGALNAFLVAEQNPRKWFAANIPHYARLPIQTINTINGNAKISISMPGAGIVCFRHCEAPMNAVMLMKNDGMAFPFEWIDGKNCIMFPDFGTEIETAVEALSREDLYDMYVEGVENCRKYQLDNFTKHFSEKIKAVCE